MQVLLLYLPLSLHLPHFLPFFLNSTELDTEEVFGVVMKTRFGEILLTELCRTKFLSSLQINGFLNLALLVSVDRLYSCLGSWMCAESNF